MSEFIQRIWSEDQGQDIAEYAVMLAVILVLVVGTIRLVGSNANNVFSNVGRAEVQQNKSRQPELHLLIGRGSPQHGEPV